MLPVSKKKAPKSLPPKKQFGHQGETRACAFLRQQHWSILERNFRAGQDEIDIIALDPQYQELVFIEVKTRHRADFGDPSLAVNQRKLQALIRAANTYLQTHHYQGDYRFDIIAVLPDKIEHFTNITWP